MNNSQPNVLAIIIKYSEPLQRYASFIIKDPDMAVIIVKNVFELLYDENRFDKPEKELRLYLKNHTLTACTYWRYAQALQKVQKN